MNERSKHSRKRRRPATKKAKQPGKTSAGPKQRRSHSRRKIIKLSGKIATKSHLKGRLSVSWSLAGTIGHPRRRKPGRPRKNERAAEVGQLRKEGKTWGQVRLIMNKKHGVDRTSGAYWHLWNSHKKYLT